MTTERVETCTSRSAGPERPVTLELREPSHAALGDVDQTLYVQVLKRLLGEEVRQLIREELVSALTESSRQPRPQAREPAMANTVGSFEEAALDSASTEKSLHDNVDLELEKHQSILEAGIKELATSAELKHIHRGRGHSSRLTSLNPVFHWLRSMRHQFGVVRAPDEDSFFRRLLEGRWWNAAVNIVVIFNCVVMALSADHQVRTADIVESTDNVFFWLDVCLLTFYSAEFFLKLAVYGRYFFYDVNWKSNYLDSILLFTSLWSITFTVIASVQELHQNYTWLRLFRLLRLLRTLRVIRLASHFNTLHAILSSLLDSFWMLTWSLMMLSLMYFMFSLIFVSRVAGIIHSNRSGWENGEYAGLVAFFGSVSFAMKTLMMASTGGADWGEIYDVIEASSRLDAALFLFFVFFIQIAVMNIILGIFVEDAMKHMQPDTEQKAHQLALEQAHLEEELRRLCCKTDLNQSGRISTHEWEAALEDGKVHELLDLLGFPRRHANNFFDMMAHTGESGDKYVNVDEFVKGCIKLRGFASSFDMNAVLLEVRDTRDLVINQLKLLHSLLPPRQRR